MKKIKFLVYFFVISIIIVVSTLLIAPSFIDFNTQRDRINQALSSQLGMPLQIDGNMAFQLVPRPYIKLANVRVLPYDGEVDLAKIDIIEADFSLQKLFMGQLVFSSIRIEKPQLNFMVSAEGVESWTPKRRARGASSAPKNLRPITSLGKVSISDIHILYDNKQQGRARELRNAQLNLEGADLSAVTYDMQGMIDSVPMTWSGTFDMNSLQEVRGQTSFSLGQVQAIFDGRLADPFDEPLLDGTLSVKGTQPLMTLGRLGIVLPLPNDMPISQIDYKARAYMSGKMVRFEDIITTVNESQATGKVEVRMGAETTDVTVTLRLDRIRLDDYFPQQQRETERWSSQMIDLRPLQSKNLKLDIQVGEVTVGDYVLNDVALKGESIKGIATLESLNFNLAGGNFRSNGRMDIGTSSRMRYTGKIDSIPFAVLVAKPNSYLDGRVTADFDFNFTGESVRDYMSSLTGQVNVNIPTGTLQGVRIEDLSLALNSMYAGKNQGADSPFENLKARLFVENGIIRNDDFGLVSGEVELLGNGKIDLVNGTINYRLRPVVNDKLGSVVLPVTLRGSIESPSIIPDLLTPQAVPAVEAPVDINAPITGSGEPTMSPQQPAVQPQQGRVDLPFNFGDDQNLRDNVLKFLEKNE